MGTQFLVEKGEDMIPYDQMKAMADQRMARYESDADRHRMISNERRGLIELVKAGFARSGLDRIGKVLAGNGTGPVQPAI